MYCPVNTFSCLRNTHSSHHIEFLPFLHQNLKEFPIYSLCFQYNIEEMLLSVHQIKLPRLCPPCIRGTDKQLIVILWKCMWQDLISHSKDTVLNLHTGISHRVVQHHGLCCIICSLNKHQLIMEHVVTVLHQFQ